jgi:large subunit ribosomal protein L25
MSYTLTAEMRTEQGKGASRRLRKQNGVPAVIYGGDADPKVITIKHNEIVRNLMEDAFYEAIITLDFDGEQETVILQDLQRHPYKPIIMHADFKRASADDIAAAEAAQQAADDAATEEAADEE